jgi:hypothetical protein
MADSYNTPRIALDRIASVPAIPKEASMRSVTKFALALIALAARPALADDPHKQQFVLDFQPRDYIAASLAPGAFPASFPAGVGQLSEPAIQSGLLIAGKLRDSQGGVVGFATEQSNLDLQAMVATGTWTLTIPGRGALFLSQQEDVAPLFQILGDMQAHGELERNYSPPLFVVTTIGVGYVIGGTGEFAGARGTFRELDFVETISLATGVLRVTDRLEIDLKVKGHD